ncbi:MAG: flagellar protein FliT [Armatimonadota bacterium]
MLPEEDGYWQKWLAKHGERIRVLCALQESAIRQQDWDTLHQVTLEKEQILESLWQCPPAQLPPEALAFVQELWHINQQLQRMMEECMSALQAELAHHHRTRDMLQRYYANASPGSMEDRAA